MPHRPGSQAIDLTGNHYGRLTVHRLTCERTKDGGAIWECRCDCGNVSAVPTHSLRSGNTTSCGCYGRERSLLAHTTHGRSKTPEFAAWINMRSRCWKPNHPGYKHYGGRGITICDTWTESFERFYADMGPRPSPQHSIDRINNDGPYSPDNCRWATSEVQTSNYRRNRELTLAGRTMTVAEWAREFGIPWMTLRKRMTRWPADAA